MPIIPGFEGNVVGQHATLPWALPIARPLSPFLPRGKPLIPAFASKPRVRPGPGIGSLRKMNYTIPVEPLPEETSEGIVALLESAGGVLPLGKVMQEFRGVKRVQLEGVFELARVGQDGQFEVKLPGAEFAGSEIMFQGQAFAKDAPLPPLDTDSIDQLKTALLLSPGFTTTMGRIREIVPGVRREQLENAFNVVRVAKKDFRISLKPEDWPESCDGIDKAVHPLAYTQPESTQQTLQDAASAKPFNRGMFQPPAIVLPRRELLKPSCKATDHFWRGQVGGRGRAAVEPLTFEQRGGITQLLEAAGGVLPLGRVMQEFRGLKRSQLEGVFDLGKVGRDGQFEVRLPGCIATGAEILVQGQTFSKDDPLPALDADSVALIKQTLEQQPDRWMHFGKVKEVVPGIRFEQLENDFFVTRVEKKNFIVSLQPPDASTIEAARRNPSKATRENPVAKRQRVEGRFSLEPIPTMQPFQFWTRQLGTYNSSSRGLEESQQLGSVPTS